MPIDSHPALVNRRRVKHCRWLWRMWQDQRMAELDGFVRLRCLSREIRWHRRWLRARGPSLGHLLRHLCRLSWGMIREESRA